MQNQQACVWATSSDLWDSFLNDPELALAIENARSVEPHSDTRNVQGQGTQQPRSADTEDDNEKQHRIGARLRAYETPITDEILRQSIR